MNLFESLGIDAGYVLLGTLCVVLILIALYIVLYMKFRKLTKNYEKFMTGTDAENLESAILAKFTEIDAIDERSKKNAEDIRETVKNLTFAYQKFSIIKYDAFKEMGGKLSFSLCMLTDNNDGFILTSVHSTNEGCYSYLKEIIKGESYVLLSEDEKKALQQAKSRKSCLDD